MDEAEIWRIEEAFWTEGEDHFARTLDPACLMTFPGVGVLDAAAAMEALRQAPRWRRVAIEDRRTTRPDADIATLGYRARAHREGAAPYEAWCSSSYRLEGGSWRLFQHQQSPV